LAEILKSFLIMFTTIPEVLTDGEKIVNIRFVTHMLLWNIALPKTPNFRQNTPTWITKCNKQVV